MTKKRLKQKIKKLKKRVKRLKWYKDRICGNIVSDAMKELAR